MGGSMKTRFAPALCVALCAALIASTAQAGGPVVVVEDPEPKVVEKPASSSGILPWLAVPVLLCIVLCGSDDDTTQPPP
jgi:hypothetical protein